MTAMGDKVNKSIHRDILPPSAIPRGMDTGLRHMRTLLCRKDKLVF